MMLPLATLVHISDLHFGNRFTTDENLIRKLATSIPYVQGTFVHSYQAARALASRVNQIAQDRETNKIPVCVVFTGDLTSSGQLDQFGVGTTFLRGAHWTGAGSAVGLRLGEDRDQISCASGRALFAVPGNHDIWGRKGPDALGAYMRHFPKKFPVRCEIEATRKILLYGIDSTQNTKTRHKLARGRIAPEELDELCQMLEIGSHDGAIQIVCLHHPLADYPEKDFRLTMQLDGREGIAKRFVKHGATLVLSGHVHDFFSLEAEPEVRPNLVVTGSGTQQFSERSFWLIDIYEGEIHLSAFVYDTNTREFLPQ